MDVRGSIMRRAGLGMVFVAAALCPHAASASCLGQTFSQFSPSSGYHYVDFPASATKNTFQMIGRFWSPGAYATTGEQGCDEAHWLTPCTGCPGPYAIDGTFGEMGCTSGCPDGEMIVLIQDRSTDGTDAFFAVGRVDATPSAVPDFDFARIGRDWLLRGIPPPDVISTTSGDPFLATIRLGDPSSGFFGLAGVPATGTITAFRVYRIESGPDTRDRAAWSFVDRIPYVGGDTFATLTLRCPWTTGFVWLAAALELDDGEVVTDFVSRRTMASCDPYTSGAGRIPETGDGALRVSKTIAGELELTWGPSCIPVEDDYEIYEGFLGDRDSHVPKICDTGGQRIATFQPPPFDAYYLIVPFEGSEEGSYGTDSDGEERGPGPSSCRPKIVNLCP